MTLPCRKHAAIALVAWVALLTNPATAQQQQAPSVTVTPVFRAAINPTYTFIGQTEAVSEVELRARVEGFLEERNFTEGEDVSRGESLFVIERATYESDVERQIAAVDEAKASLALAEATLARRKQAARSGAVSKLEVDMAAAESQVQAANVKAAEAQLRQARLNLSYTDILSPLDGRIGRETYSVGNLVSPESSPLATIIQLDPIYVVFNIAEAIYTDFRMEAAADTTQDDPGKLQRFTLQLPNKEQYDQEGELNFVDNRVDPNTGTIAIRVTFPNPDRILLPGQFVTIQIRRKTVEEEGLLIPQAAVQQDQAGEFVLVVNPENVVETKRVTMGERVGINWQVIDGLTEGERVIYQGIQKARPGSTVDPVEAPPADPGTSEPAQTGSVESAQ